MTEVQAHCLHILASRYLICLYVDPSKYGAVVDDIPYYWDVGMGYSINGIAFAHFAAGGYERAVEWVQRSLARDPDYHITRGTLAASHAHLGQADPASRALQEMLRRNPELSTDTFRSVFAIAAPAFIGNWLDGLRKAGLPE